MERTHPQLSSLWWFFLLRDDTLSHQPRPHSPKIVLANEKNHNSKTEDINQILIAPRIQNCFSEF